MQPLLAVLGAVGATTAEPGCTVETEAGASVAATRARCEEVAGPRVGSSLVVTGAVGVNATDTDVAPRLLFGVLGRI